jgi:ABC-type phosphonate transport system ATPase subunit
MMTDKTYSAEDYLNGNADLPADFDTGYRHHLEVAREIVRRRKVAVVRTPVASSWPREETNDAPAAA